VSGIEIVTQILGIRLIAPELRAFVGRAIRAAVTLGTVSQALDVVRPNIVDQFHGTV
jgi:hypothetical protein